MVPIQISEFAVFEGSEVVGVQGITHDISHYYKISAELTENRQQLTSMVDNIPGTIYRCLSFHPWTMLFISDEVEKRTGHPACYFMGDNPKFSFGDFMHPDDTELTSAAIWGC